MSGRPPFPGSTEADRNKNIIKNEPDFCKLPGVSKIGKDFITKCLNSDTSSRPHISEMLEHPWIKNIEEMDVS